MRDELQEKAVRNERGRSVEDKAAELTPELRRQAQATEAAESQEDISAAEAAPEQAADGVAAHEEEMRRRGFQPAEPPRD